MSTITLQPTDNVVTGTGSDTLVVPGNSAGYIVERTTDGFRLIDISEANLGRATNVVSLFGIGTLQFGDVSVSINERAGQTIDPQGTDSHDGSDVTNANGAIFNGGSGNDTITGSNTSRDIAIFSGALADYWISSLNGKLQVRDLRPGSPDGVDTIVDVEFLRFADTTISVANSGFGQRSEWFGGDQDERSTDNAPQMLFMGGGGNDNIKGSSNDIVIFSGAKDDYVITRNSDGSFTVNDRRDFSPDGIDVVYGVRQFRFSDGVYASNSANFTSGDKITSVRTGTSAADRMTGTNISGNDFFEGLAGNDTLSGQGGHDQLFGGAGADRITGGIGHDHIEGGAGADTLDGGVGLDTLSYATSNAFVTVNLATNRVANGHAVGDKIKGFENIEGSEFGDNLTGSNLVNTINGRGGNDTINGGAGADRLDGGEGIDTLSYASSRAGVTVNLTESEAWGGDAGTINSMDRIFGFENVIGTALDDAITGDDKQNTLTGGRGNDQLIGLAGADILNGEDGADVLTGGLGNDLIYGGAGNDTASYQFSATGVSVTLRAQGQTGGEAEGDQLFSIENLDGSDFNDTLVGNDLVNVLAGGAGDDILEGGLGADRLVGGDGIYTATYRNATAGLIVTTTGGTAGEAAGDVLVGIENLEGSNFSDELTGNERDNILTGGAGNDRLFGGLGNDSLFGGDGHDQLFGGMGADILNGNNNNDSLFGGDGADDLYGDANEDRLYGGAGNDRLFGGAGLDVLYVGQGTDTVDGGGDTDTLAFVNTVTAGVTVNMAAGTYSGSGFNGTFTSVEQVSGTIFADTLTGGAQNDALFGGDGNDTINGGAGDDVIDGGLGIDDLDGGDGIDILRFTMVNNAGVNFTVGQALTPCGDTYRNFERYQGTRHNDTLTGSTGNDNLLGGGGSDTINGMDGNDILDGESSDDTINGGNGNDMIYGGWHGTDSLFGGDGNDELFGESHNDLLEGGAGDDKLYGGSHDDILRGSTGADIMHGGGEWDYVDYQSSSAGVTIVLNTNGSTTGIGGDAEGDTLINVERALGSVHQDTITGDALGNVIRGNAGNDFLYGGLGDD